MTDGEKVFLLLAFVAIFAIAVWQRGNRVRDLPAVQMPGDMTPTPPDIRGPGYLTYNQPWGFSPPVAMMLPKRTRGFMGQGDYCGCAAFTRRI